MVRSISGGAPRGSHGVTAHPDRSHPSPPVGAMVTVLAIALFISAVRTLRAAGTPIPGNRPTTAIVSTGPYRFSRNPIYLAFSLLQLGLALWVNSLALLITLIPAVALMWLVVIQRALPRSTISLGVLAIQGCGPSVALAERPPRCGRCQGSPSQRLVAIGRRHRSDPGPGIRRDPAFPTARVSAIRAENTPRCPCFATACAALPGPPPPAQARSMDPHCNRSSVRSGCRAVGGESGGRDRCR
jgi:hypothetical protein